MDQTSFTPTCVIPSLAVRRPSPASTAWHVALMRLPFGALRPHPIRVGLELLRYGRVPPRQLATVFHFFELKPIVDQTAVSARWLDTRITAAGQCRATSHCNALQLASHQAGLRAILRSSLDRKERSQLGPCFEVAAWSACRRKQAGWRRARKSRRFGTVERQLIVH